jgi:hypothetical protein
MKTDRLKEISVFAQRVGHIFVATADKKGLAHISAAGKLTLNAKGLLSVSAWFCPGTVANLSENRSISLVVWDAKEDVGFQLLGKVKDIQDVGVLDGYAPAIEAKARLPQVERKLLVEVDKIIEFRYAPHSDIE